MADKTDDKTANDGDNGSGDPVPDLNALAKEYLDLWQQQLAETARDGTLAKTMSDAVRLMSAGAAQMAANMPQPTNNGTNGATGGDSRNRTTADGAAGASGAASVGAPHRHDDDVVDELHRRVAELEKRIGVLERRVSGEGRGPR